MKSAIVACLLLSALAAGQVLTRTAETEVPVGYIVELPAGYDSARTYPLVVAIHGFGDRMEAYIGTNSRLCPEGAIGLYPESPYPMLSEKEGPPGFTWEVWTDSTHWLQGEATAEASIRWILDAIHRVKQEYKVDPAGVFLFGFSQGGFLTFEVGLRDPELFAGLLPAGGWLPWDSAGALNREALRTPIRILHGVNDDVCEFDAAQKAYDTLKSRGAPVELMRYPAKHQLTRELFEDARDFVWCVLHEHDRQPLSGLLLTEEVLTEEERLDRLQYVLCATESNDEVANILLGQYEQAPLSVKVKTIYLLGARRCVSAEEFLRDVLWSADGIPSVPELRRAAFSALVKMATEYAWEIVEKTEMEVAVRDVVPGGQAESVGLRPGDIILSYDGKTIGSPEDIRAAKSEVAEDQEEVVVVVRRGTEELGLIMKPGSVGIWTEEQPK